MKKGFTLIEILIVVAIIAILASVVLVGLGPTQSLGRDARRASDLTEVQNALELYYNKNGKYPVEAGKQWTDLQADLEAAGVGINSVPNDPNAGSNYIYGTDAAGTTYVIGANMESAQDGFWNNYAAPGNLGLTVAGDTTGGVKMTCTAAGKQFCLSL
jgi:general secretion pathway protein G